jgi:hypothetical protein
MFSRICLLVSLCLLSACSVDVPELDAPGAFACAQDGDCAGGFRCLDGRCVANAGPDGGDQCTGQQMQQCLDQGSVCFRDNGGTHCAPCSQQRACPNNYACVQGNGSAVCTLMCAQGQTCDTGGVDGFCAKLIDIDDEDVEACAPCPNNCGSETCILADPTQPKLYNEALTCGTSCTDQAQCFGDACVARQTGGNTCEADCDPSCPLETICVPVQGPGDPNACVACNCLPGQTCEPAGGRPYWDAGATICTGTPACDGDDDCSPNFCVNTKCVECRTSADCDPNTCDANGNCVSATCASAECGPDGCIASTGNCAAGCNSIDHRCTEGRTCYDSTGDGSGDRCLADCSPVGRHAQDPDVATEDAVCIDEGWLSCGRDCGGTRVCVKPTGQTAAFCGCDSASQCTTGEGCDAVNGACACDTCNAPPNDGCVYGAAGQNASCAPRCNTSGETCGNRGVCTTVSGPYGDRLVCVECAPACGGNEECIVASRYDTIDEARSGAQCQCSPALDGWFSFGLSGCRAGLSAQPDAVQTLSLAMDSLGNPWVAWHNNAGAFAATWSPMLRRWTGPAGSGIQIQRDGGAGEGAAAEPVVTVDANNQVVAVWSENTNGTGQRTLYGKMFVPAASGWGPAGQNSAGGLADTGTGLLPAGTPAVAGPAIASSGTNWYVAYGQQGFIKMVRKTQASNWNVMPDVTSGTAQYNSPQVIADATTLQIFVAFRQVSPERLYARHYDGTSWRTFNMPGNFPSDGSGPGMTFNSQMAVRELALTSLSSFRPLVTWIGGLNSGTYIGDWVYASLIDGNLGDSPVNTVGFPGTQDCIVQSAGRCDVVSRSAPTQGVSAGARNGQVYISYVNASGVTHVRTAAASNSDWIGHGMADGEGFGQDALKTALVAGTNSVGNTRVCVAWLDGSSGTRQVYLRCRDN